MLKRTTPPLPPPEGMKVTKLGADLALIELPMAEPALPLLLTEAERDVVRRVCNGAGNQDIADARKVSPKTVANQLDVIYRKLNVSSRAELVRVVCHTK